MTASTGPALGPAPIVVFGSFAEYDWGLLRQRQQNMVDWLCEANERVIYVERMGATIPSPAGAAKAIGRRLRRTGARERGLSSVGGLPPENLRFVRCPIVPLHGVGFFDELNAGVLLARLERLVAPFDLCECAAFVFYPSPYVLASVKRAGFKLLVHDAAHRYATVPSVYGVRAGWVDREIARLADVASCDSRALCDDRRLDGVECLRIPQGVDTAAWLADEGDGDGVLAALESIAASGPVAGFVGALSDVVDAALMSAFAEGFPGSVVFVGPTLSPPLGRLSDAVIRLGAVDARSVPAVMRRLDVGLIPYRMSQRTEAVLPTKLVEYLASGCRVVSTPLPEVVALQDEYPNAVLTVPDVASWRDLAASLDLSARLERGVSDAVLRAYAWPRILEPLARQIEVAWRGAGAA